LLDAGVVGAGAVVDPIVCWVADVGGVVAGWWRPLDGVAGAGVAALGLLVACGGLGDVDALGALADVGFDEPLWPAAASMMPITRTAANAVPIACSRPVMAKSQPNARWS
jgi:hypothetical protein